MSEIRAMMDTAMDAEWARIKRKHFGHITDEREIKSFENNFRAGFMAGVLALESYEQMRKEEND